MKSILQRDLIIVIFQSVAVNVREGIRWKKSFLSGIALKWGGGVYPCPNILALFHQVKVPKIGTFLLKTNDICMFFVIIIIKITIITIIIIIKTIIIINGIFFCHTRKTSLWRPEKKDQVARIGGRGGV